VKIRDICEHKQNNIYQSEFEKIGSDIGSQFLPPGQDNLQSYSHSTPTQLLLKSMVKATIIVTILINDKII